MKLRQYMNMQPVSQVMLIAWITYTMACPKIPTSNFLLLVLMGGQGTGKSTLCRILQAIIDPSRIGVQTLPTNGKDLAISLQHAHLRIFDNVRAISNVLADFLCIACTGGYLTSRKLYTDAEEQAIYLHGPVIINSIHHIIDQSDQAQRCLKIELDKMDENARKQEESFFDDFQADLPQIMRELFERIAAIFKHLPDATVVYPERMIEFVHWLAAMEMVDGAPEGAYQAEYSRLLNEGQLDSLMENSLAAAMVELTEKLTNKHWVGTPAELLKELEALTNLRTQRSREWPLNPIALSKRLRSLQAGLASQGIEVGFSRGKNRMISIRHQGDKDG